MTHGSATSATLAARADSSSRRIGHGGDEPFEVGVSLVDDGWLGLAPVFSIDTAAPLPAA